MLFHILFGSGRVVAYTVHEGPTPPTDRIDRADALRFVRDGFSFPAAIAAPVWLAAHKLWAALAAYAAAIGAIALAYTYFGLSDAAAGLAVIAAHLIVGYEADTIERLDLEQRGWSSLGSVTGASALECERRFFDQWLPRQPVLASQTAKAPATPVTPTHAPRDAAHAQVRTSRSAADRLAALWRKP